MRRNIRNRRLVAEDEMVEVMPEASELLFEAEDVADLLAQVTEEDVVVEADEDAAVFTVGEDVFTVEAEGTEEIVESSKGMRRGARPVRANRRRPGTVTKRPVSATRRQPARRHTVKASGNRTVRRIGR